MKLGCHASVFTGALDRAGMERAVTGTAEAGYDLIELPVMDPDAIDVSHARTLLEQHGLAVTASLGLTEALDISSPDAAVVAAGERHLNAVLDCVADLGGTHLTGVIHSAMRKYLAPATEAGVEHSQQVLGRLASRGRQLGVVVGIEVVNRYESNVVNTARQAVEFAAAAGRVDGGLAPVVHLDTYHMNIEEPDMASPVELTGDQLGYVHIGESHRGYLGSGNVDFDTFFKALHRIGYDGPVVFESFSSAIVHPDLSRMLGVWRNLWDDPDDLARHALRAIRHHREAAASIERH